MVRPEIEAVTPLSTSKTRLIPSPLTVTPAAGPVMVSVSAVLESSSSVPVRMIVCGVLEHVRVEGDIRVSRTIDVGKEDGLRQAQEAGPREKSTVRRIDDQ